MKFPKQPLLLIVFVANLAAAVIPGLAGNLAGHLSGRPEWLGIIIGFIVLLGGMSIADGRYERCAGQGYPPWPIWRMFGVVPAAATALFWSGLAISAYAVPVHGSTSLIGLMMAALGVALSVGVAAWPKQRVVESSVQEKIRL